jgi:endonuclease/exonuclease/phosphatase family metal-dependent hydrolase
MISSETESSDKHIPGGYFMKIRRAFSLYFLVVTVFSICFAFASPASAENRDLRIKVMTRNMYPGADLAVIAAADESNLVEIVGGVVESIIQSNIPDRAELLAAEIARTNPDLVALQEATTWKIEMMSPTVELNQLNLLMNALKTFGRHYKIAAIQKLTEVELPGLIRYTDSDVILVRADLPPNQLRVLRSESHLYEALMEFPVMGGTIQVLRGWIAADVKIRDSRFKFVNTHLESPLPDPDYIDATKYLQELQAAQLIEDLDGAKIPIILAGDFNSDAEHTNNYPSDNTNSYDYIVASGFHDAWDELRPNNPGFTWSLFPVPEINFEPFERIDLIFSNGPKAISIMRTGVDPVRGLYASDHAGVVAVFDLANHHPSHHGKKPVYQKNPEQIGFQMPANQLKKLWLRGFRRH